MAELTTDAQALSEAATSFDRMDYFFVFEDRSSEVGAGMQDTEKGVTGMFASTPIDTGEAATSFDRISSDLKGAIGQVDSTAAELNAALKDLSDAESQTVQKLAGVWGGSGSDAYQQTQQRWDSTAAAADDAASSLGQSMGFTPPDDGFGFKAAEPGETASLKYNFGGIEGAASAVQGSDDGGWLIGDGSGAGIPATMAEWALLLA